LEKIIQPKAKDGSDTCLIRAKIATMAELSSSDVFDKEGSSFAADYNHRLLLMGLLYMEEACKISLDWWWPCRMNNSAEKKIHSYIGWEKESAYKPW